MADEAHRSQYGFVEGGARWMREALPNATFVGFTGTPLERDDKNTIHVFGEYADVYDIRQAVEDGATKPLYYESRIVKLTVDEAGAAAAEAEIDRAVAADASGVEIGGADSCAVGGAGRRAGAGEPAGDVYRGALGEAALGDGRQGDGRDHEPRHRRPAV
jgi:superfamily II DNA or RNA helicase